GAVGGEHRDGARDDPVVGVAREVAQPRLDDEGGAAGERLAPRRSHALLVLWVERVLPAVSPVLVPRLPGGLRPRTLEGGEAAGRVSGAHERRRCRDQRAVAALARLGRVARVLLVGERLAERAGDREELAREEHRARGADEEGQQEARPEDGRRRALRARTA